MNVKKEGIKEGRKQKKEEGEMRENAEEESRLKILVFRQGGRTE